MIGDGVEKKSISVLAGLALILEIYTYVNFATIVLFPDGLYDAALYAGNYWFLGYKNVMIRFLLPAIVLNAIWTVHNKGKYTVRLYLLIIISIATEWMVDCKTAETGVYSLVYNLSMIATVITTSLDGIWVPWFTGKLKERKIREINVLAMDYVHLMTYAMVALILVGPEILKIFADQRYWEGMSIIPPIALANYMIFMYTMYVYIEHYYKKTVYITKNTLIAAGLNVILNFILIPKYGYVAAAYTTLASYFVAFILHSRYAKKIEPDIYPLKMFALPLLHVGGAIILYYPLLNFWTLRWGILFVYLIIVLIKERFRIGTLVPVLAEKCSFFKEK